MKKPSLSSLVLATLAYSDVFQYPLTEQELHQRLIGFFPEVNLKKINQTAKQIPQMTKIEQFGR